MINKPIIIINGSGGCGKDTFINFVEDYVDVKNISSVGLVKLVAEKIGWNGGKTERDRKFLSDLKILMGEYNDSPFNYMKEHVDNFKNSNINRILFLHIREPDEINRAVNEFNAKTLLIKRPSVKEIKSNMADANVNNYNYDFIIINDGNLNDFKDKARLFLKEVLYE